MSRKRKAARTLQEEREDASMCRPRESVEHSFALHLQLFPFVRDTSKLRLFATDVAKVYQCQTLFVNLHTCAYGSQCTALFRVERPTMQEYLENINRNLFWSPL